MKVDDNMKLTKRVFIDLTIFMIGFGLVVGVIFPIFVNIIGVPKVYIDELFITASIMAGISVGIVNVILARVVVGKKLNRLLDSMKHINDNLDNFDQMDKESCLKECHIPVDSEDVIGETSKSYNKLVTSFISKLNESNSVRKFTEIFTNELDLDRLSEKAIHHLIEQTGSKAGMIIIDKGGLIEVAYSHLIKDPEKMVDLEIIHKAFSKSQRSFFEFQKEIKIEAGFIDFSPRTLLIEPVRYKKQVIALVLLASTSYFEEDTLDTIDNYTHGLALGLNNAIIHDRLEQLSILDPLTKTYNRRFGMERLKEEFSRSVRTKTPMGLIMLDLDHFKNVNDTYGHIVGDKVLSNFASLVKTFIRKEDTLIRYGGEEFLVVLPGADISAIQIIGEKIRRVIEETFVKHGTQEVKVTVSIGGSSFPEFDCESYDTLIENTDKNLYEAKDTGRNKVVAR
jgi:diguanylate cyclase (GGDEF)-like protein